MSDLLAQLGQALRRPASALVVLDRRPVRLAFLSGDYHTVTVRDRTTREVLEVTLSPDTGATYRPDELRARDRAAGASVPALAPDLLTIMLRHPELDGLRVRVTTPSGHRETNASVAEVAALAREPAVIRVELLGEPEIPDASDA